VYAKNFRGVHPYGGVNNSLSQNPAIIDNKCDTVESRRYRH